MNIMANLEEKVIELNDNENYYVIKQTIYNDNLYVLACELIDDETPSDELAIFKLDYKNDKIVATLERDADTLVYLENFFGKKIM